MKAKNQRLVLLVLAIGAVLGAVLLAMSGLRDKAAYFYAPGDIATREVLDDLRECNQRIEAVYGNVDTAELQRSLPESREIEAEGARIAVVHDAGPRTGRLQRMRKRFPDADALPDDRPNMYRRYQAVTDALGDLVDAIHDHVWAGDDE